MLFAVRPRHLTPPLATLLGAIGLLAAPAFAGPPFRTDDPEPVDFQHFEIDLFSQGTQTNGGWSGFLPGLRSELWRTSEPTGSRHYSAGLYRTRVEAAPALRLAISSLA